VAAATTVSPGPVGGALLAGAALCALAVRERPRRRAACGGAVALALAPWLSAALIAAALPVAVALVLWTRRRRPGLGMVAAELMLASLIFYGTVNERLYGGLTPAAARLGPRPELPLGYVDRLPNLIAVWLDRWDGLLRWAPALALGFFAAWLLYRSRRQRLARVAPERAEAEACAALALGVCAGQLVMATFWWAGLHGPWFPGAHLVPALPAAGALTAWGLRHAPRALGAVLGALTLGATAWLLVELRGGRLGGWLDARTDAPWGPLVRAFPDFEAAPAWAAVVSVAIALVLGALAAREWRASRALRRAPVG
jgi:hypothetical protein